MLGLGVGLLTLLLAAQLGPPPAASRPSLAPTVGPTAAPATLELGVVGRIDTLDPLYATLDPERDVDALVFRGLTRPGPGGGLVGDLAASWTIGDGGHTYTFQLVGGARWADGQAVTAADVAYTVSTLQDPDYDGILGGPWRGVTVSTPDASTVVFRLQDPAAGFLDATTQPIVPAHLLRATPVAQLPALGFASRPVGDGPYEVADVSGDAVHLVLGPDAAGSGAIPAVTIHLYADPTALADAFAAGTLDGADGLSPAVATALAATTGARALRYPEATLAAAVMNVRVGQPLFRDVRVRAALLAAVDRPSLAATIYDGAATVAVTPFLPGTAPPPGPSVTPTPGVTPTPAATPAASPKATPAPLVAAAAGLTAAGWKKQADGWHAPGVKTSVAFQVVTVDAASNPDLDAVAHAVVTAWASLGLHVTLDELTPPQLVERLTSHDFQVAVIEMDLGLDADLQPLLASSQAIKGGTNLAGYENAGLDRLLANAHAWAPPATQAGHRAAVAAAFAAQLPFMPLVFPQHVVLYRATVTGPTVRPLAMASDRFWDVLTWRLAGAP